MDKKKCARCQENVKIAPGLFAKYANRRARRGRNYAFGKNNAELKFVESNQGGYNEVSEFIPNHQPDPGVFTVANMHMTRRQALKALIASGGAIGAASFVPARWLKPVVKSGVLPVHAQTSAPLPGRIYGTVSGPAGTEVHITAKDAWTGYVTSPALDAPGRQDPDYRPPVQYRLFSTATDASGNYTQAVPAGSYDVYAQTYMDPKVAIVAAGQSVKVDFEDE